MFLSASHARYFSASECTALRHTKSKLEQRINESFENQLNASRFSRDQAVQQLTVDKQELQTSLDAMTDQLALAKQRAAKSDANANEKMEELSAIRTANAELDKQNVCRVCWMTSRIMANLAGNRSRACRRQSRTSTSASLTSRHNLTPIHLVSLSSAWSKRSESYKLVLSGRPRNEAKPSGCTELSIDHLASTKHSWMNSCRRERSSRRTR